MLKLKNTKPDLDPPKCPPPYSHFAISGLFMENESMLFINFTIITHQFNFNKYYTLRKSSRMS